MMMISLIYFIFFSMDVLIYDWMRDDFSKGSFNPYISYLSSILKKSQFDIMLILKKMFYIASILNIIICLLELFLWK